MKNKIRELREAYNISLEKLGKALGIQRSGMGKIEEKNIENIQIRQLLTLAQALGCSPWELMGLEKSSGQNFKSSPGVKFRKALAEEKPLQIVGAVNAYAAMLAEDAGYRAIYLSGGGVAACSHGLPDLGITTLYDVLEDARRITAACALPLLVDIDVGWGGAFNIARTIREMERAGIAAVHIEDQILQKRCGHRPNKEIVSAKEMQDRIKAATDARTDKNFIIMARTDALAVEGLDAAIARACAYVEAGADMIFAEAMTEIEHYRKFRAAVKVPLLANLTEFGKTPYYAREEMADAGADMLLYPLSAFRAMSKAAIAVYEAIRRDGHQKNVLPLMQTREELYERLNYHDYERKLDTLFGGKHD